MLSNAARYNDILRSTINVPEQFNILHRINSSFRDIYPKLDGKSIENEFKISINNWAYNVDYDSSVADWDSSEHMNLKQLTGTKIPPSLSINIPDMLKFQLAELYALHNNNALFLRFYAMLTPKLMNKQGATVTVDSFKTTFKDLSINIKRNIDYLTIDWLSLIDIDLLVGYNLRNPLSVEDKKSKVYDWCKGYMPRGNNEQKYYQEYTKSLLNRLNNVNEFKTVIMSLDEFILNVDLWMTDGSSRGIKMKVFDVEESKYINSKSKKQVIGLLNNVSEIVTKCRKFDIHNETYAVSEKIEPGKKYRCIISAHYIQQIRLAYIEYCLGTLFNKLFPDIYFLNSQKVQKFIIDDFCRLSQNKEKRFIFLPLDASAFDQEVSQREVTIIFEQLINFVSDRYDLHPDVTEMLNIAAYAWFNSNVIIDKVYNMGKWEHGVPSGIRWTALVDSIVNNLRFDVCMAYNNNDITFGPLIIEYSKFQGDDMSIILRRAIDVVRILNFYSEINVTIHPYKNFLSLSMNEFLRKIYMNNRQYAYPNRMITKYLFRLPEKSGANTSSALCRERTTTVFKMACRANNMKFFEVKVLHIFKTIYNIQSTNLIMDILCSPSVYGGFGFIIKSDKTTRAKRKMLKITWPDATFTGEDALSPISLTGVYAEQLHYLENIMMMKLPTKMLNSSIVRAIDPVNRTNFNDSLSYKVVEFKFSPGFSLRFNFTNTGMGRYRPWMSRSNLKLPSINDLLSSLKRRNDVDTLITLTAYEVTDVLNLLRMKGGDVLVWDWVEGRIPEPSVNVQGLNDLSRADLMRRMYYTYVTRLLTTRAAVSILDFERICVAVHLYATSNLDFAIVNNYVMYTID